MNKLSDEWNKGEFEVDNSVLEEYERSVFIPRAKRRALFLLGKKEYTQWEMRRKLTSDGYSEGVIEVVSDYLKQLHYVEDVSFAERYALARITRYSERELFQKMVQKGFEKELIKEAIQAAKAEYASEKEGLQGDTDPETEAIRSILRKKGFYGQIQENSQKRKLVASLYRKGFSLACIQREMGMCEEEYNEEFQ